MEEYKLFLRPSVQKYLASLPKEIRTAILANVQNSLTINPFYGKNIRKLRGFEKYRLRFGGHRVIYSIDKKSKVVAIEVVGHRKDVYRGL